jgi:transposase
MWCIPMLTPEFIARMEDTLDLYARPYDPKEPVLCFDEKSKQLLKDTRRGVAMKPGKPRRRDYEYARNGVRNIFLAVEPKGGFRTVSVTRHRKKPDFARDIERIAGLARYRKAKHIHIVLDNLNTHFEKSLIETFGPDKTKRMMRRIRFHYTPKHGSWLNMAEIELSIMGRQCMNRRIPTESKLVSAAASWEQRRNSRNATINWRFTKQLARRIFKYRKTEI